jgi:IS30 family transposase
LRDGSKNIIQYFANTNINDDYPLSYEEEEKKERSLSRRELDLVNEALERGYRQQEEVEHERSVQLELAIERREAEFSRQEAQEAYEMLVQYQNHIVRQEQELKKVLLEKEKALLSSDGGSSAPKDASAKEVEVMPQSMYCCVCMEIQKNTAVRPCNHLCLCEGCDPKVDKCPICRGPIAKLDVMFM